MANFLSEIKYEREIKKGNIKHWDKEMLEYCLRKRKKNLIFEFNDKAFTEEIIDKYSKYIVDLMEERMPLDWCLSPQILKACLEEGRIELLTQFANDAFTEEIVNKYANVLVEMIDKEVPLLWSSNPQILKACLEKGRADLVFQFKNDAFSEEIIEKYSNIIIGKIEKELPWFWNDSKEILKACLKFGKIDLVPQFKERAFSEEIIDKYAKTIVSTIKEKLPRNWHTSPQILRACLENERTDLLPNFISEAFTKEIISKYGNLIIDIIKINFNNTIPDNLKNNQLLLNKSIELKKYDTSIKFTGISYDIFENEEYAIEVSKYLNISKEELTQKLKYLYDKNNSIFYTLRIEMLSKKMSHISIKNIEQFAIYPDFQESIISLNENQIKVIAKLSNNLDSENYDLTSILHFIIKNINNYNNLLENIDIDSMNEEQLKNLLLTLQMKNNLYKINNLQDLNNENYEKKVNEFYKKIEDDIKDDSINLESLKEALLIKKYGLDIETAKFIHQRYCHDMSSLKKSKLDENIYKILESINEIYTCNSKEKLKFIYITSNILKPDFHTAISLETSIRSEYAKMFSNSLYKIKEKHRLSENSELYTKNRKVYDLISSKEYQGKKPNFYILDGNFNLQVHVLGAYNDNFSRPDNFMDAWNKPKIAYHGLCTSYIGNNQIAIARSKHPVYGFSNYEESALLLAGNYDLHSDAANREYATSMNQPYTFYPPQEFIKYTRHNHNEMVLERRSNKNKDNQFKRMPDYILYFVDDINNTSNFDESNMQFNETIQAAIDHNIPIVIVDRLKYAKSELEKCLELEKTFLSTKEPSLLEELFLKHLTNMISCKKNDNNDSSKYHEYFNQKKFEEFYKRILKSIADKKIEHEKQIELINCLKELINKELSIKDNQYSTYFKEKLIEILALLEKIEQNKSSNLYQEPNYEDMMNQINTYYYHYATKDERLRIKEDLKNEISIEVIIYNINNEKYKKEPDKSHERK